VLPIDPWCRRRFRLDVRAFCFRPSQPFGLTAEGATDPIYWDVSLGQPLVSWEGIADKEGLMALALLMQ
jgi:hypothetical protein